VHPTKGKGPMATLVFSGGHAITVEGTPDFVAHRVEAAAKARKMVALLNGEMRYLVNPDGVAYIAEDEERNQVANQA